MAERELNQSRVPNPPSPGVARPSMVGQARVLSAYDTRPINAYDTTLTGWGDIVSAAGIATTSVTFPIPAGYTFVLREFGHIITPAIVGYPANPTTAGKGIIVTIGNNFSGLPGLTTMNLMQAEEALKTHAIIGSQTNLTYFLSIVEDVANQFNASFLYVKLSGNLILSSALSLNQQVGSNS